MRVHGLKELVLAQTVVLYNYKEVYFSEVYFSVVIRNHLQPMIVIGCPISSATSALNVRSSSPCLSVATIAVYVAAYSATRAVTAGYLATT